MLRYDLFLSLSGDTGLQIQHRMALPIDVPLMQLQLQK